jgi:plasmid stability protein
MTTTGTKAIIVRDVPEDEHRIMRASAALSGVSLQAWCLAVLRERIQQEAQQTGGTVTLAMAPTSEAQAPTT